MWGVFPQIISCTSLPVAGAVAIPSMPLAVATQRLRKPGIAPISGRSSAGHGPQSSPLLDHGAAHGLLQVGGCAEVSAAKRRASGGVANPENSMVRRDGSARPGSRHHPSLRENCRGFADTRPVGPW